MTVYDENDDDCNVTLSFGKGNLSVEAGSDFETVSGMGVPVRLDRHQEQVNATIK